MVVLRRDGKVKIHVYYRDLNKVCPGDDFPLRHNDLLVDNTTKYALFSFIDRYLAYNQIEMAPKDKTKTSFITHWGIFSIM